MRCQLGIVAARIRQHALRLDRFQLSGWGVLVAAVFDRDLRAGSVRLDTQRAEISGACQFLLCPELSTAAVGRRLHDERPIAAVGNSHALRVVQFL